MNKILKKEKLSENTYRFRIEAGRIAKKRKAGQFIILRPFDYSERIPLTIANGNPEEGWIEIIFQVVGATTIDLASMKEGDEICDLVGPLGKPTHIEKFGKVLCVGGGVGIAPLFPIVSSLKDKGNDVTVVLGARDKSLLLLEEEMKKNSSRVLIATDNGTKGKKGFVTDIINELFENGEDFDFAVIIGPPLMMKFTSKLVVGNNIPAVASLNPIMIDGTGMCGGCRVTVNDETKFACVDGPEFDAAGINWDELINRLNSYTEFEERKEEEHKCKLGGLLNDK